MSHPSPNASDEVWSEYLNSLTCEGLLAVWCSQAAAGNQRIKTMAIIVAGARYFTIAMRARIMEEQMRHFPCAE